MTQRVVIAKMGIDGHVRGANYVVDQLREAGVEVIYLGRFNSPADVATAVVQEDADTVGLSFLSNEYREYVPALIEELERYDAAEDVLIVVGGIISENDREDLYAAGVDRIYTQEDDVSEFVETIAAGA